MKGHLEFVTGLSKSICLIIDSQWVDLLSELELSMNSISQICFSSWNLLAIKINNPFAPFFLSVFLHGGGGGGAYRDLITKTSIRYWYSYCQRWRLSNVIVDIITFRFVFLFDSAPFLSHIGTIWEGAYR